MRSFAEDGSHAPPGASHKTPFCSTSGTRQRPRCRSKGRWPPQNVAATRPRPPLLFYSRPPLGFRPLPGASPLVGPPPAARVHLLARWRPSVERRPGERALKTKPAPRVAVLISGRVSLTTHRHAAASGLRSGRHRAGKAVTLPAGRSARKTQRASRSLLLKPGRRRGLQKQSFAGSGAIDGKRPGQDRADGAIARRRLS
jgi:hypothetical protein